MTDLYTDRCVRLGQYMTEHNATVRETAAVFGISKSTVHKDVTDKLRYRMPALAVPAADVKKSVTAKMKKVSLFLIPMFLLLSFFRL